VGSRDAAARSELEAAALMLREAAQRARRLPAPARPLTGQLLSYWVRAQT
jgi:type II secretory pathway pseudopilin PulG